MWRRGLAASFAALACWLALGPYGVRGAPATTPGLVTTSDLPIGHVLRPDDVQIRALPRDALPEAALRESGQAVGRPLAAAVTRGELLTSARIRAGGPPLPPGTRAVHLPLTDPSAAGRLAAGDHVDLLAVADGGVVVSDAVVVDVDKAGSASFGADESGRGITVAVSTDRVGAVTTAALGPRGGIHAVMRPH